MRYWLWTRHVAVLAAAAAVCGLAVAVVADGVAPMPVVIGGQGTALWSTFLPLVWAVAVADVLASTAQAVEVRPSRRLLRSDAVLFLTACVVGCTIFALGAAPLQTPLGVVGHVAVLTGLAGWVTLLRGVGAGALAASSLLVITTPYGINAPMGPFVRVLQPDGNAAWAFGLGLGLCLGCLSALVLGFGRFVDNGETVTSVR